MLSKWITYCGVFVLRNIINLQITKRCQNRMWQFRTLINSHLPWLGAGLPNWCSSILLRRWWHMPICMVTMRIRNWVFEEATKKFQCRLRFPFWKFTIQKYENFPFTYYLLFDSVGWDVFFFHLPWSRGDWHWNARDFLASLGLIGWLGCHFSREFELNCVLAEEVSTRYPDFGGWYLPLGRYIPNYIQNVLYSYIRYLKYIRIQNYSYSKTVI